MTLLVASYTDKGSTVTLNWTQVAGGPDTDLGLGIVACATGVYVGGIVLSPATFGNLVLGTCPRY